MQKILIIGLGNWRSTMRIQNLQYDDTKIQLASLRMEGAALVWWESKTKEEIKKQGKIILSWSYFKIFHKTTSLSISSYAESHNELAKL